MLDQKFLVDNLKLVDESTRHRGLEVDLSEVTALNDERKRLQTRISEMRHEHHQESQKIGQLFREKKKEEAEALRARLREASDSIKAEGFTFYGGHCTGGKTIGYFRKMYGDDVVMPMGAGRVIAYSP